MEKRRLIYILIIMPLMAYGQIIQNMDVDSILIKKAEWGRNMCESTNNEYFEMVPYPEFIVSNKEHISLLIDSLNSLKMIDSNYDKRWLGDIECKLYFLSSDHVTMVIPMSRRYLFTQDARYHADSLSTTIDKICETAKTRESRASLKFDYLPYEGGKDALYKHLSKKIKKEIKQVANGKYKLWIVCHADKKGKTLDAKVFNEFFSKRSIIPTILIEKLIKIILHLRWTEDKTRMETDIIVIPIYINIHDNPSD